YAAFKQVASRAFRKVTENNIFGLGVVLGFIPCGLVYAAGAKAATSGGAISGMLTMLAFGLGTVPALLMVGLGAQSVSAKFRYQVFRFATLLVIALGIMTTYRGATQLMAPRDIVSENGVVICTH
ncbi:MAG TPA: sulfite exporter TauE/SafE family protein, partial [Calditrichia bacterium]|nr:sulfite exporter TauE/SafE family protein [Calditrichia bacterium]